MLKEKVDKLFQKYDVQKRYNANQSMYKCFFQVKQEGQK